MHKLLTGLLGAAALATATAGNATVTLDSCSMACTGPTTVGLTTTIDYFENAAANPFTESLTFTNTLSGLYAISLVNTWGGVDFSSAVLSGPGGPYSLSVIFDNGTTERWALGPMGLLSGQYTLTINGNFENGSTFGGHVVIQSVPEPATWAMMLLGFGAIGLTIRNRRRKLIAQTA